jgi:hypothetical protein
MSNITITINTDNSAFRSDDGQVDTLSREVLRMLETADFYDGSTLMDIHGNTVGKVEVSDD